MTEHQRILVRTPNWVGDAVMALPFLSSLRLNAPDSEISLLTRPSLSEFYEQVSDVDHVLALDESGGQHGLRTVWRNAGHLKPTKFDLGFCLPPSFGSALMMCLAGVRRRVGHSSDRRGWLLTYKAPYLKNGQRPHRAEGYLSLLNLIWENANLTRTLNYDPGHDATEKAASLLRARGLAENAEILAVAPGAAQPNKLWRSERFAHVCRLWLAHNERVVLLVGGGGDREAVNQVEERFQSPRLFNLVGLGSLPDVAAIVRRAKLFIGNDSGLSHLAAAVGTPVVAISGPGDPSEVAPFTEDAITVKKPVFCSPCYSNTCFRKDHPLECQDLVAVDDVWGAANTLLGRLGGRKPTNET